MINVLETNEPDKEIRPVFLCVWRWGAILNRMMWERFIEKMAFGSRLEEGKGSSRE